MHPVREDYDFETHVKENSIINMVLCGETMAGKTALVTSYEHNGYYTDKFKPNIHDTINLVKYIDGSDKQLHLVVQDTSGLDEHEVQRISWYEDADVFMLCFAKDQNDNGDDRVEKWITEIRSIEPRKPIGLLLTKNDLEDENQFTEDKLEWIKSQYNLQFVCSTSSKEDSDSVINAFDESIWQACK